MKNACQKLSVVPYLCCRDDYCFHCIQQSKAFSNISNKTIAEFPGEFRNSVLNKLITDIFFNYETRSFLYILVISR